MQKVSMLVTNPCTNDARVLKEAKSLSENGYDVTIHAIAKDGIANFEKKDGFQIKRLNRVFKANSILGKFEFTIRSVPLLVKQNADIYHAHDCSTLLECYIASRIKRSKLVYDSHELYIRNYGNKSFGEKIYSLIEKKLIKKVNKIITVNEFIARELQDRYNL
ncbi:MAG: glycosyltransferase family 4 protein, partial [bacterium]